MSRIVPSLLAFLVASGCGGSGPTALTTHDVRSVVLPTVDRLSDRAPTTEVNFEKWFAGYPVMTGNTDLGPGTFSGTIRRRVAYDNGVIVKLEAEYVVKDLSGKLLFAAVIDGTENLVTQAAALNGVVTDGPMVDARVHVTFDVISPCDISGVTGTCFRGIIRIQPKG